MAQEIESEVEEDSGSLAIWILDDNQWDQAKSHWQEFCLNPNAEKFLNNTQKAKAFLQKQRAENEKAAARTFDGRKVWTQDRSIGLLTILLILFSSISTYLFLYTAYGDKLFDLFSFDNSQRWERGKIKIFQGEIWRLVTPIFLHGGILHILFNMMWLKDLGTMIELRQGWVSLLIKVLVLAIFSNTGQFILQGSGNFLGMSGVVYGLLGYLWMKGKFDPASGLFLHESTVLLMIIWFFVCLFGIMPGVANGAHAFGLAGGMLWGYLSALKYRKRFR